MLAHIKKPKMMFWVSLYDTQGFIRPLLEADTAVERS